MREVITGGNELVARAAIDVGCSFFGGYPITPSSEVAHEMSVALPKRGGKFIQMEDEIGGISVALGAAMSGKKAMTATSGPGISLKAEQIGYGFMAEIPLVIVDVMRGGPSTGLPTRVSQGDVNQTKSPSHGDFCSIAIAVGNVSEAYTQTVRAFNLSEKYMTPVFLLLDETIGHMHTKAQIPEIHEIEIINREQFKGDPKDYKPYGVEAGKPAVLNPFFKGYRYHITGLHHAESGFPTEDEKLSQNLIDRLFSKIENNIDDIVEFEEYYLEDAEIAVVCYGSVSLAVKEAISSLRRDEKKVGMFRPITLWPSPKKQLKALGDKIKKILVVELNKGQYIQEVERVLQREVAFLGKANGRSISPTEIIQKIQEF
ncbi:MAG: 2-oxoglutarate synthase subunit alpha [Helicobacter sp.]|uniref:2-oxoglutarate synthase subunit alpha n=1 Tax=Helicobacter sp. 10-6591 TaxID=2004998 RepID=UPI000DCBC31E|nr:2-oxoglutarate synthase subunit alpha [Helicobacter sp. 10-6591]MCI6218167.1 2-oxoglutarate synthase subunit alpha [Helicobacter sp.]MCI7485378.1 2-oxoglutarate synthase subunit alpha [Helicobacter sp.]MDD7568249.1 2-oxoglutarate synthase subunit alpha [Helicobacter sp.]MDY5740485.1 2-oxoglutarate synthase subunit alpha [Helicobacter sp.]RAX56324.1 2-oxoglutarate synthase subunit alpha [Helicobacter sp. 10-6591]